MTHRHPTLGKESSIAVITLDLADTALDMVHLSARLKELCSEISWDDETKVVIVSGASIDSFVEKKSALEEVPEENNDLVIAWPISGLISQLDQPVIAAINGNASGLGLELALACDIRIAVEQSYFDMPQVKMGLIPSDGGTQRLPRLIGRGMALQMILTGERIDAHEAYRIGLVNRIVSPDALMISAMNMAREMVSRGPIALKYVKEAIREGMDMTLEQGLHLEADLYLLLHSTKDRTEGIKAFLEKRKPEFEAK
jgi:enoyl-CoA hydratase